MKGDVQNTKWTNRADKMTADLERIAREILSLETLETRNSDSLDFSEQAVWTRHLSRRTMGAPGEFSTFWGALALLAFWLPAGACLSRAPRFALKII
jgi:hypothetical protein